MCISYHKISFVGSESHQVCITRLWYMDTYTRWFHRFSYSLSLRFFHAHKSYRASFLTQNGLCILKRSVSIQSTWHLELGVWTLWISRAAWLRPFHDCTERVVGKVYLQISTEHTTLWNCFLYSWKKSKCSWRSLSFPEISPLRSTTATTETVSATWLL